MLTLRGVLIRDPERRFCGWRSRPCGLRSDARNWFCEQSVLTGDSIFQKHAQRLGKTKNAKRRDSRRFVLTIGFCFSVEKQKAPRGVHYSNRGFVELGAFDIKRLRRVPIITFHAWNAPPPALGNLNGPKKPACDPLRLARYYQSFFKLRQV